MLWKDTFGKFDIFPTEKELKLLEGMSHTETINYILGKYKVKLDKNKKKKIYLMKKEKMSEIFQYKIFPYVLDLLNFLKENKIKLAVVTGSNEKFADNVIENFLKIFLK